MLAVMMNRGLHFAIRNGYKRTENLRAGPVRRLGVGVRGVHRVADHRHHVDVPTRDV